MMLPWVAPDACTLPTEDQPLRVREFDDLFATAVTGAGRRAANRLQLALTPDPSVAARAADLAMRESACCSFFTFALTLESGGLRLEVSVPDAYTGVLDGLAARVPS